MSLEQTGNEIPGPIEVMPTTAKSRYLTFSFMILIASIALFLRLDDLGYVTESLWGDDGFIFIEDAHELGVRSLWSPHVGYLFLYHRIVALLASQLPLVMAPYIFSLFWLMAFFSIVWILNIRGNAIGFNELLIVFLVSAIALQPSSGVPFFNLNHSHFFLGIALALYICIPSQKPASLPELLFLILTSLSGPFSAFIAPILALQLAILRDFSSRKAIYIVVPICGLVQSILILASDRIDQASQSVNLSHWLQAASSLLFFGKSDKLTYVAATFFWCITLVFFFKWVLKQEKQKDRALWLSPVFAAATAIILFLVSALSMGDFLPQLSPFDMSPRYFLIPYSLAFFISLACTQAHRTAQMTVVSLIGVICAANFVPVGHAENFSSTGLQSHVDLQWTAFTKFQKIKPNVIIPINAPWPIYPPVASVQLQNVGVSDAIATAARTPILLTSRHITPLADRVGVDGGTLRVSSIGTSPIVYLDITNYCETNRYIALEVQIWRSRMGWARMYWGQPGQVDSERSLARFYPDGDALMQFAFRRDPSDHMIRFDPAEGVAESAIVRTLYRVKERWFGKGAIVAEPTEPGGEVRVKEVRLFCLE